MTALTPEERPDLRAVARAFESISVQESVAAGRVSLSALITQEERRLAAVRRFDILGAPPEEAFDRVAHLARRLLDVPIALISIVDADREWFKSRQGIATEELSRAVAVGEPAVRTNRPVTVADVQLGDAFADNPVVRDDPDLHGFAAVPLRTYDGHAIGTLCVFDRRPRRFSTAEIADLQQLAAVVVHELDLRLASRRALFPS